MPRLSVDDWLQELHENTARTLASLQHPSVPTFAWEIITDLGSAGTLELIGYTDKLEAVRVDVEVSAIMQYIIENPDA